MNYRNFNTSLPIASVPNILSEAVVASAISRVRYPSFNTLSTALITNSDSAFIPKEISNNKATDNIEAKGLATPLPVIS